MRLILFLTLGVLLPGAAAQAPAERLEGPAVKVDDAWIYNKINGWNGELEDISVVRVKEVTAQGILLQATALDGSSPALIRRTAGFNVFSIEAPNLVRTMRPHYPNFSFPLWVGKTWEGKVAFESSDQPAKMVQAELRARVAGYETVTVPAGTFYALKIVIEGAYWAQNLEYNWTGRIEDMLWYAPQVRNAVRYEYRDSSGGSPHNHEIHELVNYWLVP